SYLPSCQLMRVPQTEKSSTDTKGTFVDGLLGSALDDVKRQIEAIPASTLAFSAFTLGSTLTIATGGIYRRFGRRIRSAEWVTPDILRKRRRIRGIVTG